MYTIMCIYIDPEFLSLCITQYQFALLLLQIFQLTTILILGTFCHNELSVHLEGRAQAFPDLNNISSVS